MLINMKTALHILNQDTPVEASGEVFVGTTYENPTEAEIKQVLKNEPKLSAEKKKD